MTRSPKIPPGIILDPNSNYKLFNKLCEIGCLSRERVYFFFPTLPPYGKIKVYLIWILIRLSMIFTFSLKTLYSADFPQVKSETIEGNAPSVFIFGTLEPLYTHLGKTETLTHVINY